MDIETVRHIAKLSNLRLTEDELMHFTKELGAILDYVKELDKVNTKGVEPTPQGGVAVHNVFREDERTSKADIALAASLVNAAPDHEDGYVKVKAVL